MDSFNQLTPAEAERLALMLEELGEAQQAIGKILRHGYEEYSPFDESKTTNREALARELGHVIAALTLMAVNGDVSEETINLSSVHKSINVGRWLHHNEPVAQAKSN
ncbi:MAG: hypothetical protein AB7E51_06620 [Pseudodesulfovibrio sp.]|uniref:hypothetical protein n=1 Tax=Pseudodesulfovibrio sp. TaxID=2035812 RepID=UPI003D09A1AA